MPFTGHIRKMEAKSGITTYQIVVEEENNAVSSKRKRYYKTVKGNKKQAEKAMREFITELENKTYTKDSKITVAEFMHQWIELYVKNQLSPTTVQHYIDQTEKYIIPQFGKLYLQQLRNIDVQKWVFDLQKNSPLTGKPLSPKTIKNIVLNLSAAMKKAVMLELIAKNPCENLTLPKLQRFQPEIYSMEEVEKMINSAKNSDMYLPLMIEICLGLRRGELLALKWHHINFEEGTLTVEENLVTVINERITKTPKTKSGQRCIQIPQTLLDMLQNTYLDHKAQPNDYIICQKDGMPYKSDSFSLKFRRFLKANNLKHIRFHDLRHINATIMLTSGISPKVAQERLGHANYQITMDIYSHVLKNVEKEAADKIDSALFEKPSA
jgi:integrase